ncbi:MAG: AMP-binding protein [Planctomycetota bacterium]
MLGTIFDFGARFASPDMVGRVYRNTPAGLSRRITLDRFRRTVRWAAAKSPFYKRMFAEHGIDASRVREPADLGSFFTTPDDLTKNPEEFLCQKPAIVFESSGTSGKNKQVYYSRKEWEQIGRTVAGGFRMMGIGPDDRVANGFDFSIWIPGLLCHYGLMANGNFCQAFGKVDPVEVYRRLAQQRINVVMGEPTWLIRLTEIAERQGPLPLKVILGGAEEMPAEAVPWMERVWSPAKVKMCYASVEMATSIGFQPCPNQNGYHLDVLDFAHEIIEPDEDGFGELVFTTLSRRTMPLIRYRTRDVTRITPGGCSCGLSTPHMAKLRGRRDELVVASGGNLYPLMFERIITAVAGLTFDWQVVFRLEGIREVMEIHVETTRPDTQEVEREIHRQATIQYPDLMKNLALGIFEMKVVFHMPGGVRVKRKLKRLIDLRYGGDSVRPVVLGSPEAAV